jgi:hypothetical protein
MHPFSMSGTGPGSVSVMPEPTPQQLEAMQLYGAEDVDELETILRVLDADDRRHRTS